MIKDNVLASTTIFLNAAVSCENLLLIITGFFFHYTLVHTIHFLEIHRSDFNRSVNFYTY